MSRSKRLIATNIFTVERGIGPATIERMLEYADAAYRNQHPDAPAGYSERLGFELARLRGTPRLPVQWAKLIHMGVVELERRGWPNCPGDCREFVAKYIATTISAGQPPYRIR